RIGYGKLLIATGSVPTQLHGASGDRFIAMRSLANYRRLRELVSADATAIVVGGGFIGTEIAAALAANGVAVTLIFPQEVLGSAVFPAVVADRFQTAYLDHGVTLVPGRLADHAVVGADGRPGVVLDDGSEYYASVVVAGLSAKPDLRLGSDAGLEVNRGIVVDEHLKTSDPVIWAAGDIAEYPDVILGRTRIEHVDHAQTSGATAGRSMAGSEEIYDHTPFFWSDAFEIGWEAIGRLDARLDTEVVDLGEGRYVVYYLDDKSRPVGVLLWGVWDSVDKARQILAEAPTDRAELRGRIV
ncbi:MAG: FAD-dependent oxidoreductase, partial [Propionibacterium sp.]|nr:FAD-dependent oxidoreductase [Propionibacterium sp.]